MSLELAAVLVTTLLELAGLVVLGIMAWDSRVKMDADDAVLYLQSKRIEETLREMRAELLR